jgi:hypothetical protein
VWNAPATDGTSVYFTTGNTNADNGNPPLTVEPYPNYGLSMIRVDKDTGQVSWAFQPVPFKLDDDPDWAAGAAVMSTSCGKLIASVQKDGWSYAVNAATGHCRWQFPLQAGEGSQRPDLDPVVLSIEAKLRRAGKGKRLVIGNGAGAEVNEGLAAMIGEAFVIRNQLLSGSDASIEAMTERLGMGKGHLTSLVRLSYLAPGIVRALLEGRQPIELTPTRLLRLSKDLPHDWKEQRCFLGFPA